MVFKKILVAIDNSPLVSVVFEQALEPAQKEGASLMLFHCINSDNLSQLTFLTEAEAKIEQAQAWLRPYCQKAKDEGIPTKCVCEVGQPGSSICRLAQSWGANLIILGRKDDPGLVKMLLGSVSNHVVHNAPCSVLIIKNEEQSSQQLPGFEE
jgi:nucleotide-binding universal stress UspA family protein